MSHSIGVRLTATTGSFISSLVALLLDVLCVFGGLMFALWIRFETGLIPLRKAFSAPSWNHLLVLCGLAAAVFVVIFHQNDLYRRPQNGRFEDKIPRIVKCILLGFLVYIAAEAFLRLDPPFSRIALGLGVGCVSVFVLLQKYIVYRIEWNLARHMAKMNRVLIVGTDQTALRVASAINHEPFLRAEVVGFVETRPTDGAAGSSAVPANEVVGTLEEINAQIDATRANQVILADAGIGSAEKQALATTCEKAMLHFSLVPDLYTQTAVEIVNLGGIPLLGIEKWPLDYLHCRILKRSVDMVGAVVGLVLSAPVILVAGAIIKANSPGPVFYRQQRCGKNGRPFTIYKLRTMRQDAEAAKPGWTVEGDPRVTPIGRFLRRTNLDEVPQFWNVLLGQMSLVGPRPERPVYVEQFKEEIDRYMRRHVSRPGMTGWAQVNGLRGDTSISERIRFDLYYLENWSLSLDFKILLKTFTSSNNAY